MKYLYMAALGSAAIFFTYIIGTRVGNIKCNARVADVNAKTIIQNTKILEDTNETVFHTTVGDIRHILREKYTIAE